MNNFRKIYAGIVFFIMLSPGGFAQVQEDVTIRKQIYESVEAMPEFPGGIIEMELFVIKHLKLPDLKGAQPVGGIYTRFVVNTDGSVSDIKIARSSGNKEVDDSVKAVISRMPLWKPGTMSGKPVNCYYNLPISSIKYK